VHSGACDDLHTILAVRLKLGGAVSNGKCICCSTLSMSLSKVSHAVAELCSSSQGAESERKGAAVSPLFFFLLSRFSFPRHDETPAAFWMTNAVKSRTRNSWSIAM
jgi:hypothetical protein